MEVSLEPLTFGDFPTPLGARYSGYYTLHDISARQKYVIHHIGIQTETFFRGTDRSVTRHHRHCQRSAISADQKRTQISHRNPISRYRREWHRFLDCLML